MLDAVTRSVERSFLFLDRPSPSEFLRRFEFDAISTGSTGDSTIESAKSAEAIKLEALLSDTPDATVARTPRPSSDALIAKTEVPFTEASLS